MSLRTQVQEQQTRIDDLLREVRAVREQLRATEAALAEAKHHGKVLSGGLNHALDAVGALRSAILSFKGEPGPKAVDIR